MNDEELRGLIRDAIQRHLGAGRPEPAAHQLAPAELRRSTEPRSIAFGQYQIERLPGDTMCIIEPAVSCNHCGFCKCHGH